MPEPWGLVDVAVRFGDTEALAGVSLQALPGQIVAVVGGDGAGKTTLLRTLVGRVEPDQGSVHAPPSPQIGYQPSTGGTWANLTVDENLDLVAGAYRLDATSAATQRDRLLAAAGLTEVRGRLAAKLSGGMRQKLGFCMAMLHEPILLVLDEPSTGVDPVSRVELWSLIAQAATAGAAVVMSTTYLDEAERVQNVLVLDNGRALIEGPPEHVTAAAPGTVVRLDVPTDPPHAWRRGRVWHQWHEGAAEPGDDVCPDDMEDAVIASAMAVRTVDELPSVVPSPTGRQVDLGSALARSDHVTRRFGADTVVDDVTLAIAPGEIVGLIGANGAGKTTLIRMQLGLLLPTAGRVSLFGLAPSRRTRERLGYVPQGLGLYRDLTVQENLDFVAHAYPGSTPVDPASLAGSPDDLVAGIGLGRQRQLAFAAALSHSPELLVLDEPTSGVDPLSRARLWDTIHAQADSGVGVLVSTHYMQEAEQCDRLILLDLGRTVAEGTVSDIVGSIEAVLVDSPDWSAAFAALSATGLPVALSGTTVRVVDTEESVVAASLAAAGVPAALSMVPATLEERMTAIARQRILAVPQKRVGG